METYVKKRYLQPNDWKDISGMVGLYLISNEGDVFGCKRRKDLSLTEDNDGYLRVGLSFQNKVYSKFVHRLVAEAFIPNPEKKPQVNHKDGNKKNNNIENLEWSTAKENINHAHRTGLATNSHLRKKVECIYPDGTKKIFESIKDICCELKFDHHTITYQIKNEKAKNRRGYKFSFV